MKCVPINLAILAVLLAGCASASHTTSTTHPANSSIPGTYTGTKGAFAYTLLLDAAGHATLRQRVLAGPGSPTYTFDEQWHQIPNDPNCPPGASCIEVAAPTSASEGVYTIAGRNLERVNDQLLLTRH